MCENSISHMNTLAQMARKYRGMCKQVQSTDNQIQKVRAHLNELGQSRNRIIQDMEQLKTLIDYCVITGTEPTQALLSHSVEQMNTVINEHDRNTRFKDNYYTLGGSSVTVINTHNTTATHGLSNMLTATPTSGAYGSMGVCAPSHTHAATTVNLTKHVQDNWQAEDQSE